MSLQMTESQGDVSPRISWWTIFCFALPPVGAGYMFCLVSLYIMKYATDVLLIAPAIMGLIFGFSRFWDAISDPLAGYLSDKTNTRWGRRRPWIFRLNRADWVELLDAVRPARHIVRFRAGDLDGSGDCQFLFGHDDFHCAAYVTRR